MPAIFPASTNGGGMSQAWPDLCKTPTPGGPVPVPYPNMAMLNRAKKTSKKVKIVGKQTVTTNSEIPKTNGDEAGTAGGVVSGTNMGPAIFKKGSTKVKIEGHPIAHVMAPTSHNGTNANAPMGQQVSPSQLKVTVAP